VRLEHQEKSETVRSPELQRLARELAHAWLARLQPVLEDPSGLSAQNCRSHLKLLVELRGESGRVIEDLEEQSGAADADLLQTVRQAVQQLDHLEEDLRKRLGLLAPGDPAGAVDLDQVRDRLAEIAARREVETITGSRVAADRLELATSHGSVGAAFGMGIFAFGWLSFTTVHAIFMIGGMASAFGWAALGLLGFYSIFFMVGFGMAWAALRSLAQERLELNGRELTLHRNYRLWRTQKSFTLGRESRARIVDASVKQENSSASEIAIRDANNKEIRFGMGMDRQEQKGTIQRLNDYLQAQR
jgi:hypothetical protein